MIPSLNNDKTKFLFIAKVNSFYLLMSLNYETFMFIYFVIILQEWE